MNIHSTLIDETPRDSATLVLLRDGTQGLEVFMVQRHADASVLGGAYVFPGGKLDEADTLLDADTYLDATEATLHATLQEPYTLPALAKGLYVAALRETFEESGVLIGSAAQSGWEQRALHARGDGLPFATLLAAHGIRLATRALVPWSRWVTPQMPSVSQRRFDTRFFVARVPTQQHAHHDEVETTHSQWIRPADALHRYGSHRMEMAPPQLMTLAHLGRFGSVDAVLAEARRRTPPYILPHGFDENGVRTICYPGDPQHSVLARAMPGPTRLVFRKRRFEPPQGPAHWFN